ncbi:hypothetical protein TWF694_001488 [Orbilia ellipsospora]|uniref:Peptidase metallopeptidase domain-containing protein n=1 Tax=Orbilia ellipsospora TaxID=2528407 RepID=A0AAV9XTM3_9PEZI
MPALLKNIPYICKYKPRSSRPKREGDCVDDKDFDRKWPAGFQFRWKLEEPQGPMSERDGTLVVSHAEMEQEFEAVFQKWTKVSGYKFRKDEQNPNLKITVLKNQPTVEPFEPSTYAQAYTDGGIGYIEFNNVNRLDYWTKTMVHNVFLHEMGHIFGLGHVCQERAVMYPELRETLLSLELTPWDITHFNTFVASNHKLINGQRKRQLKHW